MKNNGFSYYLTKYFADYLPNQRAASFHTIHSYRDTFIQLLEFFRDRYGISAERLSYHEFTIVRIEEFLAYLEEKRGVGIRTRNQRLAAIHSYFRYIQYRDPAGFAECAEVLSVPFKKAPVSLMNYMNLDETRLLFSLPDQKDTKQLRELAIMILLYESGARVQELLDLCPIGIRYGSISTVELHGKGNKKRLVPINADATSIIKNYIHRYGRNNVNEPLFVNYKGEKLTRAGIQYIIDKYVSMARQKRPDFFRKRITNHCFRHSKAMHLLESGVNLIYIRDLLGHTSVITTETYAKTNPKIKEEQLKKHSASVITAVRYTSKEKEDLINWLKNTL